MNIKIETQRSSLIDLHTSILKNYLELLDDTLKFETNITNESISYNIFVHSGMLFRYTADVKYLNFLQTLNLEKHFKYAFSYISHLKNNELLKNYIGSTNISESTLFKLESLISVRDELQAFDQAASSIVKNELEHRSFNWLSKLTNVKCFIDEFDLLAMTDKHLISLACEDFYHQRETIAIDYKKTEYWWYNMHSIYLSTNGRKISDSSRIEQLVDFNFRENQISKNTENNLIQFAPDFIANLIKNAPLPDAASSSNNLSSVVVWDGISKSKDVVLSEPQINYSNGFYLYAEIITPITEAKNGQATAEWKIFAKSQEYKENTSFFLLENKTGKVLGTGLIENEGYAVLGNASWDELKLYKDKYIELTILIINRAQNSK